MPTPHLARDAPLEALPRLPTEAPPLLEGRALAQLREIDPTGKNRLIERVLTAFQISAARLLPQLATARRVGDRAAIRLVAHTFKSSAANIGAPTLAHCAAQAEAAVCDAANVDLDPHLDAMTAALAVTLRAIEQRLVSSR